MSLASRMGGRFRDSVIRHGGWSLPAPLLERLRNLCNYALGVGSASDLSIETSGEVAFLRRLAALWSDRNAVVIVDVGAHHGEYTGAALAAFEGRARIDCFEPDPANYETLAERLGPRARCHRLALSDRPGDGRLFTHPEGSWVASLHPEALTYAGIPATYSTEVEVDTLDRVAKRLGIDHIDLLKVDVEGHELAVLRGAARLLGEGTVEVIQFEFGEHNIASRTYLRDFRDLLPEHRLFRLSPSGLTPVQYRPSSEVFLMDTNYVAAHRATSLS
jgi:FkbM family methyltransferase